MTLRAYLDLPDGLAVRIGPEGLLVGRHRACDLQLVDETASRRHALLRIAPEGVELVVLGRHAIEVNDRACAAMQLLAGGDRLRFPGLECRLRVEQVEETVRVEYCLRRGRERIPLHASPFVVGTGAQARVVIAGWPEEALRFRIVQDALYVDAAAGTQLDGVELSPDASTALQLGSELRFRDETFRIEQADGGDASTLATGPATSASAVVLHPLPRGGRVTFTFADGDRTVYLPGRRFQLVTALVEPPAPQVAGEFIHDDVVVPIVWDDNDVGGRQDINVLLTRCRQDLLSAGIAASSLLERAPGGRATRIVLAPGAVITTVIAT